MKKVILLTILMLSMTVVYGYAQMGGGHMMGQGYSGGEEQERESEYGYTPYSQRMGSGMMGYGGYGMGPGMMGHMGGYGMSPGMMGHMGGYGMSPGMMGHMGGYGMGPGMMGHMGGYGMGPGMMGHMCDYEMGSGMMGRMGGYGYKGYDREEYKEYREKYDKYMKDTSSLRKKLHNKKFDYFEAMRNPDTDRDDLIKIQKELRDLQWEIYEKSPR